MKTAKLNELVKNELKEKIVIKLPEQKVMKFKVKSALK